MGNTGNNAVLYILPGLCLPVMDTDLSLSTCRNHAPRRARSRCFLSAAAKCSPESHCTSRHEAQEAILASVGWVSTPAKCGYVQQQPISNPNPPYSLKLQPEILRDSWQKHCCRLKTEKICTGLMLMLPSSFSSWRYQKEV